jgi:hypothetical protein
MGFVERELEKLNRALDDGVGNPRYPEIYAAQQALAWALDPEGFQSPSAFVTCSEADSAGCSAGSRPAASLDSGDA